MPSAANRPLAGFYSVKLHPVINHQGELLTIRITPGNVDDRKGLLAIASGLFGTLYAGKGYIGKEFVRKMKDKGGGIYVVLALGLDVAERDSRASRAASCFIRLSALASSFGSVALASSLAKKSKKVGSASFNIEKAIVG